MEWKLPQSQDHHWMCCRPAMLRDSLRFPPLLVATVPSLVASTAAAAVAASACCAVALCVWAFASWLQLISIFGPLRRPRVRRPPTVILVLCGPFMCRSSASSCASCSLQPASSTLPAPRGALNYYNLPVPRVVSLLVHSLESRPACVAAAQLAARSLLLAATDWISNCSIFGCRFVAISSAGAASEKRNYVIPAINCMFLRHPPAPTCSGDHHVCGKSNRNSSIGRSRSAPGN